MIIPCTLVFYSKRNPSRENANIKCESKIYLQGDLMDKTRKNFLLLSLLCMVQHICFSVILSLILNWRTVSVKWVNAFIKGVHDKLLWVHQEVFISVMVMMIVFEFSSVTLWWLQE